MFRPFRELLSLVKCQLEILKEDINKNDADQKNARSCKYPMEEDRLEGDDAGQSFGLSLDAEMDCRCNIHKKREQ